MKTIPCGNIMSNYYGIFTWRFVMQSCDIFAATPMQAYVQVQYLHNTPAQHMTSQTVQGNTAGTIMLAVSSLAPLPAQ
ncbi:hypothetical protein E2C01_025833 [Portunus trituberculatus]|uniref:Uncharacterized protein n=1 Tax=Portunus trituberculatus TaxID=210409 RepID=A0A5B7EDZ1_PORTR|nr:hypothetical protein [Portunus trituberculatus]